MANRLLFGGGNVECFTTSGTVADNTTGGSFDSSYADCAIAVTGAGSFIRGLFVTAANVADAVVTGETHYFHFELFATQSTNNVQTVLSIDDSSNQPWLALRNVSTTTLGWYMNTNTGGSPTYTLLGTTFSFPTSSRYTLDLKITLGSPHTVELTVNNALHFSGTQTSANLTSLSRFTAIGLQAASVYWFSQIMATVGLSTINGHLKTSRPDGAGANTAWTGAYTDVDEAVLNDADLEVAASAGLKTTHTFGNVTVPTGFYIPGVFYWVRGKNDGSSPLNIKPVCRVGGADYTGSSFAGIGTTYAGLHVRYDADPTATPWTQTSYNAAEFGFEAAA